MRLLLGLAAFVFLACGSSKGDSGTAPIGNTSPDPAAAPVSDPAPAPASGDDRDGDGTVDASDMCPDDPEDLDGFEDEDGCPDPDNDRDGILDMNDRCPNEPETMNGQTDDDGCPP